MITERYTLLTGAMVIQELDEKALRTCIRAACKSLIIHMHDIAWVLFPGSGLQVTSGHVGYAPWAFN